MPSIFQVIVKDHNSIREMISQLIDQTPTTTNEVEALTNELVAEIKSHCRAEEQAFYEVIKEKASRDDSKEVYFFEDQHEEIEDILDDIYMRSSFDDHYRAQLLHLREALERHWTSEEQDLFAIAKMVMDEPETRELGALMSEIKTQVRTEIREDSRRVSDSEYEGFIGLR